MSALNELYDSIRCCEKCEIARSRVKVVPGEGAEDAEIMFIGEAPGFYEDQQGRPFVGPAGKFLDELLASINLNRQKVYIANVIKCRPPANRDPLPQEILNCRHWLNRQIEIINPKAIVTLGRYSMAMFFPQKSISKIHGTAEKRNGKLYVAMYHPAAALHQGNLKDVIKADFLKLPGYIADNARPAEVQEEKKESVPIAKQLNMFED
ncbi:MAG: uracil-DNA glycosylase [Dehalococcoidales bacterium]|nr:uracil-DNA glycosylase [Dehalococcoidales bacterium]